MRALEPSVLAGHVRWRFLVGELAALRSRRLVCLPSPRPCLLSKGSIRASATSTLRCPMGEARVAHGAGIVPP
jgi:hypothetical protein